MYIEGSKQATSIVRAIEYINKGFMVRRYRGIYIVGDNIIHTVVQYGGVGDDEMECEIIEESAIESVCKHIITAFMTNLAFYHDEDENQVELSVGWGCDTTLIEWGCDVLRVVSKEDSTEFLEISVDNSKYKERLRSLAPEWIALVIDEGAKHNIKVVERK